MFTSSFGWTSSPASVASTSFAFMFELVPEPVWKTSIGNWLSSSPSATRDAAPAIRSALSASSSPSSAFARAAAPLIRPSQRATWTGIGSPETGKFAIAFVVSPPHSVSREMLCISSECIRRRRGSAAVQEAVRGGSGACARRGLRLVPSRHSRTADSRRARGARRAARRSRGTRFACPYVVLRAGRSIGLPQVPRSSDSAARRCEQVVPRAELHARPPVRLAGGALRAVDRLPARVDDGIHTAFGENVDEVPLVRRLRQRPGGGVREQDVDGLRRVFLV